MPGRKGTSISQWQLRAASRGRLSDDVRPGGPRLHHAGGRLAARSTRTSCAARGATPNGWAPSSGSRAERHGAIRVGTPARDARRSPASSAPWACTRSASTTCARPSPAPYPSSRPRSGRSTREELARNPFRVFTSHARPRRPPLLRRRTCSARLEAFLAGRELFPPELLALADRAEAERGLPEAEDAERFLALADRGVRAVARAVDRAWYRELESGLRRRRGHRRRRARTHINHLTPRVLDIDELYARMSDRGIAMIDAIQGPPRWDGPGRAAAPDVLPRPRRAARVPRRRRRSSTAAPCACGSARSRPAASR